jgi:hypothetical protein
MPMHRFVIRGPASLDMPLRVLNLFAQRDLPIVRATIELQHGEYVVAIEHHDLSTETAAVIVEKMRAMVLVRYADLHITSTASGCGHLVAAVAPGSANSRDRPDTTLPDVEGTATTA